MRVSFARATLFAAVLGAAQLLPALAGMEPSVAEAKAKKKKPKKGKKPKAEAAPKKVTAQAILKWHKSGMTEDEIVARASEAGYSPTAKDRAALKKGKAPKSLIAALDPGSAAEPVAEEKPKAIDLTQMTDPNDIDFDSVPPPSGVPAKYKQSAAAPKKQLDHSARPSAPFDEKADAEAAKTAKASRAEEAERPKAAAKKATPPASAPVAAGPSDPNKKRVVFTPQ